MMNPYCSSTKSTASSDKGTGLGEGVDKGKLDPLQQPTTGSTGGSTAGIAVAGISVRKPSAVLSAITALQTKGVQVEV